MSFDSKLMSIDDFLKLYQKSGLSFFLATSTYKRIPCQRISLFDYFSTFFYFWHIGASWYDKHCCQKQFLKHDYKYHFLFFKCQKWLFLIKQVQQICCKKSYTWSKRWYGCHIWIPLIFFLIDLDILFVKFWFTDLKT